LDEKDKSKTGSVSRRFLNNLVFCPALFESAFSLKRLSWVIHVRGINGVYVSCWGT